jgi:hypothetical protein
LLRHFWPFWKNESNENKDAFPKLPLVEEGIKDKKKAQSALQSSANAYCHLLSGLEVWLAFYFLKYFLMLTWWPWRQMFVRLLRISNEFFFFFFCLETQNAGLFSVSVCFV